MAPTQLDIIRRQGEAAVRNEVNRAVGQVRRETSLVGQASRLAGRTVQSGKETLGRKLRGRVSARQDWTSEVVPTEPPPARPATDGYVRRSPVQPVYEAVNYRRRLVLRGVGIFVLILAACAGFYFLSHMGLLGR